MPFKPRWLWDFFPLISWMLLIFSFSSRSRLLEFEEPFLATLFYKSAHMMVYAVLMALWWRALSPERLPTWSLLGLAYGLTLLYAFSDEFHQSFVPGRQPRLADIFFDAAGALLTVLIIRWVKAKSYAHLSLPT